ncbi:DUF4251 domain-containing protein [Dysgonomonas sp. 25]|uniref:DUF4251 domain-containing protein n=1 Tax=Dysgonomonas sp. 25 TaxID=2302933 RepID=UPI0013D00978|nr:DUF4251 domain-containing protein [Dysgonomonas sp. 25]
MKKLAFYCSIMLLLAITFDSCKTGTTTQKTDTEYAQVIAQGTFTFSAQHVIPTRGTSRYLSGDYSVRLSGDTLDVYLPFFGRAYSAPMNLGEGGYKFVSTDFDYEVTSQKKGMYTVTVTPNDITNNDIQGTVLFFDLGTNGYGSLRVRSNNREMISFTGTFE